MRFARFLTVDVHGIRKSQVPDSISSAMNHLRRQRRFDGKCGQNGFATRDVIRITSSPQPLACEKDRLLPYRPIQPSRGLVLFRHHYAAFGARIAPDDLRWLTERPQERAAHAVAIGETGLLRDNVDRMPALLHQ